MIKKIFFLKNRNLNKYVVMDRNWIFGLCRKMSVQESICACAAFCIANSAELLLLQKFKAGLLCTVTLHYCMDFLSNSLNSPQKSEAKKKITSNFFLIAPIVIGNLFIFNVRFWLRLWIEELYHRKIMPKNWVCSSMKNAVC